MALNAVATTLLVPPANLLMMALAGFVLRRYRWGRVACGAGLIGLLVLALPIVSDALFLSLEQFPPTGADTPPPTAIVILGGDVSRIDGPVRADVGQLTIERMRAGAALHRRTGLPVLVSGGLIDEYGPSLALLMAASMEEDFAVPVRWQESTSQNTWENARNSAAILQAAGIRSVFVVTHAWHMRRALNAFAQTTIAAMPAPVPFSREIDLQPRSFIPRASAWLTSYYGLHEWIGHAWYALRARPRR